ncbi:hypothetical protein H5410_046460 [Solanum commersonii]|uniref:Uncharacterized protein n=1 Tax=Solanum commersonii TaxID=4109 RepID=A0A9J5XEB4_SOLCO|nr:hypothetical protein H5410_046460 [Solanum commersonii]
MGKGERRGSRTNGVTDIGTSTGWGRGDHPAGMYFEIIRTDTWRSSMSKYGPRKSRMGHELLITRGRTSTNSYPDHDRTVPPDENIIHGDVQERVERDGPAQAPPSIIATRLLQDTLTRILGLLEGMAQAGTLLVTSDASQTHVKGQTPNPMISLDSQNQPATAIAPCLDSMEFLIFSSGVSFHKVVDAAKELEMIQREGFE